MKLVSRVVALAAVAILLWGTMPAQAITPEIGGQLRARTESNLHRGFPPESADDNTLNVRSYLRTRVNINLPKDENTRIFVQLQDSRTYGEIDGISGGLTNDMNLGVHQAYIDFEQWIWKRLKGRVGRQELSYGNERLIGPVGWNNVGRTFDAGKLSLAFEKVTLEAVVSTLREMDSSDGTFGSNRDQTLALFAVLLPESNVEFLLIGETDGEVSSWDPDKRLLDRGTLAAYSARSFGNGFDYIANLALQGGTVNDSAWERDIAAFLVTAEFGYTFQGAGKGRVALGIDYASGDDGKDSTKIKTFNNLYYTGHKFRGYMDNFLAPGGLSATSGRGLMDAMVRGAVNFHPAWRVGMDVHLFQTAADYASLVDGSDTKAIGSEIDAWVRAKEYRGVSWEYGASLFNWSEDYVGTGREQSQFWMYSQLTVDVK